MKRGWHFVEPDLCLRFSGEPLELGNVYAAQGKIQLCGNGMHASVRLLDALKYANSTHVCRVEIRGDLKVAEDKFCGRYRWVLGHGEVDMVLHRLAVEAADMALAAAAIQVPALTDALEAKRGWIERRVSANRLAEASARAVRVANHLGHPAAQAVVQATQMHEIGRAALKCVDTACGAVATVLREPALARQKRSALNQWLEAEAAKTLRYWDRKRPKNSADYEGPQAAAPPIVGASAGADRKAAWTKVPHPAINGYLLVVENDGEVARSLAGMLRDYAFSRVLVVRDGVAAIRKVIDDPVDVVLCDMATPGMSVDMFRRAIGRVRPGLCQRLIFMTDGLGDLSAWSHIHGSGAPVLWRPFTLYQFFLAIQQVQAGLGAIPGFSEASSTPRGHHPDQCRSAAGRVPGSIRPGSDA